MKNLKDYILHLDNWIPKNICKKTIDKLGARSIKDMGKVMGELKKEYSDVLDFSKVSKIIKDNLN